MTRAIVIGAGIGGLVAAIEAARAGFNVTVIEKEKTPGGKMRSVMVDGAAIDAGPTVFTMKPVFEDVFARCGQKFADHVACEKLSILARHFWPDGSSLDLFADPAETVDAIGHFAGADEARAFEVFRTEAAALYALLHDKFIFSSPKSVPEMIRALGLKGLLQLGRLGPFATLWGSLGRRFKDRRLRQLFARYATYSGGSPFASPATLMLIADVEMQGVWRVKNGMAGLAKAIAGLAQTMGVRFHYGDAVRTIRIVDGRVRGVALENGETISADHVIFNGDVAALADGLLGEAARSAGLAMPPRQRSLSAVTWCGYPHWLGGALSHHNVFFDWDYRSEFDDVFAARRLPHNPTLYLCAQDRGNADEKHDRERIFMLINAPADGDRIEISKSAYAEAERAMAVHLQRAGVSWPTDLPMVRTGPREFATLFPGTGGALYGQAPHGWVRSITRGEARTSIEGLYRCGGSVHPGAGVPMAALSGLRAASALIADCDSMSPLRRAAIAGGTLTRSATTEPMA